MGVLIMSSTCGIRHFEHVFLQIAECIKFPSPKTGHDFDMSPLFSYRKELNQVLFEGDSISRKVILNRPEKLNILNYEMVSQMLKNLKAFENDSAVRLVILKGNGNVFCAGGDIVSNFLSVTQGHWSYGEKFYEKQLILDYILATYRKPLISLVDGIVMGGGAGLSMHGRFRIVTENTVFAMPETLIGHFPDLGASHFLSRLPGHFGEYLGLTGARLDGAEMLACGLATHFVLSKDLLALENALQALGSSDTATISEAISNFGHKPTIKDDSAYSRLEVINKCFSKETVEEVLLSLENEVENRTEKWILLAIKSIKSVSPISLKIALRSIREGRTQNLKQCLVREYTICCNCIRATVSNDALEGARAMLVDKDKKPQWEPSRLELVSKDMVDRCFTGIDDDDDWQFLQLPDRSSMAEVLKPKL
ncbi:3-hydroxyisobutyryl-CoA hydrolase 1-like [Populus nigra]|uniref:3-hydroxyisobutyryl-CoA hydrolase 1-like n=1 Tax=Populus nigra TaxID=3691 RepID=UPI002B26F69E|nr:3-hydroxyisobutyryl-CoA hydrolase 1-like [Populus nigra]